jgi:hypothetical protein
MKSEHRTRQEIENTENKPMKGNMQDKTKKRKAKREIKVHDLKPVKDPKAGTPPGPCGPRGQSSPRSQVAAVQ